MMNIQNAADLVISDELKNAVEAALAAKAQVDVVKPIVRKYQAAILADMQAHCAPSWLEYDSFNDFIVLDPERVEFLSDDDAALYFDRCLEQRRALGFTKLPDDHCPLLVSEHNYVKAQRAVINAAQYITGVDCDNLISTGKPEKWDQFVDLIIQLVYSHPSTNIDKASIMRRATANSKEIR